MTLDARKRNEVIARLESEAFDLLVIGGGITGAGIALDAASRGMRVALVEMQDFAAGTSSRSTKLIHGGLRYLKQFELRLVREVGRERAILHRNAGHIVLPEKMLLPIVKGGTFGRFGLRWGLWVYDWLAGVRKEERRVMLSRAEAMAAEPGLGVEGLKGAGLYSEYRTDDARLVMEVLKTAVGLGAVVMNYARVVGLVYGEGRVAGALVQDEIGGKAFKVNARYVVNATGAWVDSLREMDQSLKGKRIHPTKGVHLVVPRTALPLQHSTYFDVGDGRMIFAIPRDQWTYFGTTDTNYKGPLDHPVVTAEDVDYLIGAVNRMFPKAHITREMIESSWAGIRPLIHEDGKDPSQLSRKDELIYSQSGLITIAGGKLTGFRKMAEKVVDVVDGRMRKAGLRQQRKGCHTDGIVLSGFAYSNSPSREGQVDRLSLQFGVEKKELTWLVGLFGSNADAIMARADAKDKLAILRAALRYCIEEEGVVTFGDFFIRRTAMLYFGRKWIDACLPEARKLFAEVLGSGYDPDPGMVFAKAHAQAVHFE